MKTPKPPDPVATAKAQAEMNKQTAITQSQLGQVNQITPDGTLSYKQIGTWPDGTPRYEATTALSPEQRQLYDLNAQNELKLGTLAGAQTDRVSDLLARPLDLSNDATEGRLMELGRKRLDPLMQERQQQLEADLINRGIRPGSEAYGIKHRQLDEQENDAYNQLLLQGRQQSVSEALSERNQPINEITALMSGSQVQNPTFQNTPAPGVAPVDYTGLVNNNYAAQVQGQNSMLGGLAGLIAAPLGGWAYGGFKMPKFS